MKTPEDNKMIYQHSKMALEEKKQEFLNFMKEIYAETIGYKRQTNILIEMQRSLTEYFIENHIDNGLNSWAG